MRNKYILLLAVLLPVVLANTGCSVPAAELKHINSALPSAYRQSTDTFSIVQMNWKNYFADSFLVALIDSALHNNQELHIMQQEIEVLQNEVRARKGEYLPFVSAGAGAGLDKPGRYTRSGAVEDQLEVKPGRRFPEPMQDYAVGFRATWEADIWNKLRNARKSAYMRYLAGVEGRKFMVTQLVAEVASSYYELLALDNQLDIIEQNISIQANALNVVRQQKDAARLTQLAVNRFEAQWLNTQNLEYVTRQKITETENRINFLTGRLPKPLARNSSRFLSQAFDSARVGVPSQLLLNRPDIREAELQVEAAKLDVKSARARFYPSLGISAGLGFQAFNPAFLVTPESMLYQLGGDLAAPLINRNAIKANYRTSGARQLQSVYRYQQTLLTAYTDVLNQLMKVDNYNKSYAFKNREVEILMQSVNIAGNLFNSARADYAEVLLTQREALEAKMDMIDIRLNQWQAHVHLYRALGGGWN